VQRAVLWPGHCGIDDEVREAAAAHLVNWLETGATPAGDDVLGDVSQLGLRWTPLRPREDPAGAREERRLQAASRVTLRRWR
jgi:hypothetical protein